MTKGAYSGSAVHYRVLTHDPSPGIIEDDKLDGLVDPPVAETELNTFIGPGDSTVPQTTRELDDIRGTFGVKTYNESGRVNGVEDVRVVGVGTEVLVVLENIQHRLVEPMIGTLTLAQTSRFDAVSVPMAGYSWVVLSKTYLICLSRSWFR